MNDRKLKNKAERDRRIRELNDYNTKRFIDQRKAQAQNQDRQTQELNKKHDKQEKEVMSAIDKVQFINSLFQLIHFSKIISRIVYWILYLVY